MENTFYSVKSGDTTLFQNIVTECYSQIFASEQRLKNLIPAGTQAKFEIYIPVHILKGDFKKHDVFSLFLESIKTLVPFDYELVDKLPDKRLKDQNGYVIKFDCDSLTTAKIKMGVYLIRLAWEIVPSGFAAFWQELYLKYKGEFSDWQILKYVFFTYGLLGEKGKFNYVIYMGHAPFCSYLSRNFTDNFNDVFNKIFSHQWNYSFIGNNLAKYNQNKTYDHWPKTLKDAIKNCKKYITNPQLELDI